MRPVRLVAVAALALAAVAGVQVAIAAREEPRRLNDQPTAGEIRPLNGVNFVVACGFSHRNTDDVIVFPGKPGKSHDHTYVGNTTTNASSTHSTLLAGATTCHRPGDTAAYWVPTLSKAGVPVEPETTTIL